MISDTGKGSKAAPKGAKPLKRGKACMSCRFLKIRCDGEKPICGPCRTHPRDDECEYADGPGRSRTKVLEDTVSRLEARLLELENPESSTPSIMLHDPYPPYQIQPLSKTPPLHIPEPSALKLSPFSPTSTASSLPSGRHWANFSTLEANTEFTGSSGSSKSPIRYSIAMPLTATEEPTIGHLQVSLDKFLFHARHFGFFLHIPSFRHSALLAFSLGHPNRPTPGLLYVTYLLGVHFSDVLPGQESSLLTRAVQHVSTDLMSSHPNKIIHTLQAEILLCYYFLRTGALLEAKCRAGAAVALALGAGLHRIRSSNFLVPSTIGIGAHDHAYSLPPPTDGLQEAERVNGFWAVLTLHKFISVALEVPAHVCGALEAPGMQIDTPWPIDMDHYEEGVIPRDLQGNSTIKAFLNGYLSDAHGDSSTAFLVKAAILFHRAAHLTGQWSPNMHPRDKMTYDAAAKSVNTLIESFRAAMGPPPQYDSRDPSVRTVLLTRALVDAASIKLHWIFAYAYPESKQICLSAARSMVSFGDLNFHDIGSVNPIMGNLWMTACLIFVDEISRTRHNKSTWPESQLSEDELLECYRRGLTAMSFFSQESTLMRYQLTKVQEAFEAI
ncbi:hypothetical protein CPC08DRAFT_761049 [Agrocybe pediades]|nr:hypothetical protein CPC08DRAFT_761049 [Agrocybe pediades]